jgi:hypothetical protein
MSALRTEAEALVHILSGQSNQQGHTGCPRPSVLITLQFLAGRGRGSLKNWLKNEYYSSRDLSYKNRNESPWENNHK